MKEFIHRHPFLLAGVSAVLLAATVTGIALAQGQDAQATPVSYMFVPF